MRLSGVNVSCVDVSNDTEFSSLHKARSPAAAGGDGVMVHVRIRLYGARSVRDVRSEEEKKRE